MADYIPVDLGEDSVPDNTVGGIADIPDDDYLFEVDQLDYKINDNERPQYTLTAFVVDDCPVRGTTLSTTFVFKADPDDTISNKGRNRFHAWLLSIGIDLTKRKFKLNPDKIRKLRFMSRTHHETIPASEDGRFSARPVSRFGPFAPDPENEDAVRIFKAGMGSSATSLGRKGADDDDDDEKPKKPAKRRPVDDDEDEPKKPGRKKPADDDDEEEEDPKPRRKKPVDDDDEEEDPKPRRRKPAKEEEEDDEDEPAPVTKTKPGKKAEKAKPARRTRAADDDDDDEEDEKPKRRTRREAEDDDDEDEFPHRPVKAKRKPADDDEDDD